MDNFPQFSLYFLPFPENQLEFSEQLLVFSPVFFVVFKKVHGLFYLYTLLREQDFEVIEVDEPLIGVLYCAILIFPADCPLEVEAIDVAVR